MGKLPIFQEEMHFLNLIIFVKDGNFIYKFINNLGDQTIRH